MSKKIISLLLCLLIFFNCLTLFRVSAEGNIHSFYNNENIINSSYDVITNVTDEKTLNAYTNNTEEDYSIFKKGDVNLDGTVSISDATLLQKWLLDIEQLTMIQECNAIFDDNCLIIDINNVTYIQKFLVGFIDTLENPEKIIKFNQVRPEVQNYLDNVKYDQMDYTTSQIADYVSCTSNNIPVGCKVNIKKEGKLFVYDGANCGLSVINSRVGDNYIYNLTPNVVSCYINIVDGAIDQIGEIKPTGSVRMIKSESSPNVRDLGGWQCDGGTVKYGKLFRGGQCYENDSDVFCNMLKIKRELNLRYDNEIDSYVSPLGSEVDFTHVNGVWYTISDKTKCKEMLECVFDSAISNNNLYYHCAAGADRTGTLTLIILALLGVSQSDIDKDYELTCFYTGVATDAKARRRNESEWIGLVNSFSNYSGNTLRDKVVNWVLSLGFSIDTINEFRRAMINGNPKPLTVESNSSGV